MRRASFRPRGQQAVAALAAAALLASGCGGQTDDGANPDARGRNDAILRLEQGLSSEKVKTLLGKPTTESSSGDETSLVYGAWQLTFIDDRLERWVRHHLREKNLERLGAEVSDRDVLGLKRGMSIAAVKGELGPAPSEWLVYEGGANPERALNYGFWEIKFRAGRLVTRTRW